jgi:hypothetical protein
LSNREKIFRDPIYGYVTIPGKYCVDFIDTAIFQRLRRIEQTSMRVLYPTAHHDRFAHSIGVYHLGSLAFGFIQKNTATFYGESINTELWEFLKNTFLIACLMHDCGHSPFSHTFEHLYLHRREKEINEAICSFYKQEPSFEDDFIVASPAPHEKLSALILLTKYYDIIKSYDASPELAARMIMGCKYEMGIDFFDKFKNKLISLLNGAGIDVDSLDYIQRDSWASGVSNVNIDYQRLLSSIMIIPDKNEIPQIVFKKQVLSVLENISIGRNFLYKWIYSHHKVTYEQYLLDSIVNNINSQTGGLFAEKAFSVESFSSPQIFENLSFYLPTDDDIIYSIKQFYASDPRIHELFSRQYRYKAIWKTYFEFHQKYLANVSNKNRMNIYTKIKKGNALVKNYGDENILCLKAQPKLKGINSNDFFIDIDGEFVDASKASNQVNENLDYFLLYISPSLVGEKDNIIKKILSLQS